MYKHILIPTDGSDLSSKAEAAGLTLARALDAKVTALTVTPPFQLIGTEPMPIENAIEKKYGRNLSRDEMQAKSRAYATEQIAQQMSDFQRLGVLGEWDHPYKTMDFANEAGEIRAFKRVIERGFVYRGLKPVYWCFDCGSSLAEFEIEYADKKSQTLDVAFRAHDPAKVAAAFGLHLGAVFKLEQGKREPSWATVQALCDAARRRTATAPRQ